MLLRLIYKPIFNVEPSCEIIQNGNHHLGTLFSSPHYFIGRNKRKPMILRLAHSQKFARLKLQTNKSRSRGLQFGLPGVDKPTTLRS